MAYHIDTDVLVAGGGPAGTSAALGLLTYSNLKVTLFDSSSLEMVRTGEQVNPSLFDLLAYLRMDKNSFEPGSFLPNYNHLSAWGTDRISARYSIFGTGESNYQLDREKFDLRLLKEASDRGAIVLPRTKCRQIKQTSDGAWQVLLQHQTKGAISVNAKFVIDATGRQYSMGRQLGLAPEKFDQLVAIGRFLQLDNNDASRQQETLLESAEDGWWYYGVLPNQRMVIAFFTDADICKQRKLHTAEKWNQLLSLTQHLGKKVRHTSSVQPLWVKNAFSQISRFTGRSHFIAAGDAAAAFDPISSLGIGFAVSTGCQAFHALLRFASSEATAIIRYEQDIEAIFKNYLRTKSQFYNQEKRWQDSEFWSRRVLQERSKSGNTFL